jgi:hypothetical protein
MAFYDCIALEEVTIQGAESVGNSLFSNDKVLKKVTLGEGVTSLSNSMFSACNALETVTIQGPVTSIGNSAFQNCWALTEIKLPDTVTSIGTYAFYENRALTEVTIPAGVTAIASNVFQNCSSLATITILGKETTIEASAFYSIASGAKFWCYDDTPAKTYATTRAVIMLESISLDKTVSGLTLKKGTTETGSMAITTTPASVSTGTLETLTGTNVEWTSSNPNVATVDATGTTVTVIAQGFGSAEITAKTTPHSGIPMEARATVTVDPPDNTQLYTLTVNSGSGGGDFPATAMVDITANTPTPGQEFDKWTNSGGVVVNPNAAQTSVAILMAAATVTANYRFIMPAPIIDYEEEELTGLVNDGTYTFNGADGSASNTGTYDIDPGWIGKTIPIVKKAVSSVADSKTQSLAIPARPAQPTGIEKTDETIDEHEDGTMSGVTALMQYSDDAGDTWKDGDGEVIDELEPGDYLVRVKAVAGTSFASAPITVTIGDGVPQTRILTVTAPAFDDVKVGYTQPDAEYISILNEGNSPANITSVTVSGSDFVITGTTGTVGVDETNDNTWTIQPAASLTAGEYADTITVTYDGSAQTTADVSFTVNETYALTVENGEDATDDGPYVEGAEVEITANAPTSGKVFDKWTSEPEGVAFASETSATTTFTMPANAVTVTATYKNAPVNPPPAAETYALTVTDGTDNTNAGPYEEGAEVSITAGTAPEGQVFDTWTTSAGGTFTDATKESTSFTMPANAVTVTATYKDDPNGGNGEPGTDNPPDNPPQADNGWVKNDDGEWEYLTDGEAKTGWLYDTNYKAWYYLASDGVMQTGWDYVGGKWYYLASNGKMQTGWLKDNGSWYYLSGNGAMVASKWFKDTDGSWYYLSGNGKMLTGKQTIGGKAYTFKSNGVWVS